jgi:HEPN superfamily Swt1-like protein
MNSSESLYDFVLRGLLTEEALDRAGRQSPNLSWVDDLEVAQMLSLDLLDEEHLSNARRMAVVYAAIATFENSVRDLIKKVLLGELGEEWWTQGVSEKVRKNAESKMADEERVRWHKRRGSDPLNYTTMSELISIIRNTWPRLEPYVGSIEWAAAIFDVIERSRNVIMHSGVLDKEDIQRVGVNIRDWVKQVGV